NPYIFKIWAYHKNFRELIPELKKEHFDYIVDLHKNFRSATVRLRLLRHGRSFSKLDIRKWLLVKFKINLLPEIHIVDRYFQAVKKLNVHNDGQGLDFFIPPEEEFSLSRFPEKFRNGYIAIVTGGRHLTKILPAGLLIRIVEGLKLPVILLGGKEDEDRAKNLEQHFKESVLNTCGTLSIGQSASVVRQASGVLTNDTGLMHIAAAFRKPVASVWGNTVPELGMYPYMPGPDRNKSAIFEVKGLSCRPCSKLGYKQCPKKHFRCMLLQDTAAIIQFLNRY
ncbi:MAG: glycosyltransferase family 9 protein, partial [Bacteroidota bacterium]|nr:glycosyltransferase family 9 protein [Bacteroidota bacterium]